MCKEKVAEPKLRKRQPTSDGEEATSEFSKCITAVRIEVLFFLSSARGSGGGRLWPSLRRRQAVSCGPPQTQYKHFEFFHNTQSWNYLAELGWFTYRVFKCINRK